MVRQIATFGTIGLFNTLAYFVLANALHAYADMDQAVISYLAYRSWSQYRSWRTVA